MKLLLYSMSSLRIANFPFLKTTILFCFSPNYCRWSYVLREYIFYSFLLRTSFIGFRFASLLLRTGLKESTIPLVDKSSLDVCKFAPVSRDALDVSLTTYYIYFSTSPCIRFFFMAAVLAVPTSNKFAFLFIIFDSPFPLLRLFLYYIISSGVFLKTGSSSVSMICFVSFICWIKWLLLFSSNTFGEVYYFVTFMGINYRTFISYSGALLLVYSKLYSFSSDSSSTLNSFILFPLFARVSPYLFSINIFPCLPCRVWARYSTWGLWFW